MSNRNGLIEDCRLVQSLLCNTAAIDAELVELHRHHKASGRVDELEATKREWLALKRLQHKSGTCKTQLYD